jgi:GMP synthase-like glutamine amidotransferase
MTMRALIIGNSGDVEGGVVEELLCELGFGVGHFVREEFANWGSLEGVDLVVLLGSDWSVYWESVAAPIALEIQLLRTMYERGVPVLGICFGAQLLAHAFGGHVAKGIHAEIGWCDISSFTHAQVFDGAWLEWHYDSIALPKGATLLASNLVGAQAFSFGRSLGTQFHPEVTERILENWLERGGELELLKQGICSESLRSVSLRNYEESASRARVLVNWFLDEIAFKPLKNGLARTHKA